MSSSWGLCAIALGVGACWAWLLSFPGARTSDPKRDPGRAAAVVWGGAPFWILAGGAAGDALADAVKYSGRAGFWLGTLATLVACILGGWRLARRP